MGRPIEIKLDAETTSAERNLDSTADSLDDVADALDDVDKATRGADRGLDDVADAARDAERGLKDTRDGADDTARVLDRDLTRALRDVKDEAKKSAREIKDSFEENALTAEDVFKADLKAELVSNMAESGAEVARGFKDGFDSEDTETILDGLTDTMVAVGTLGGPVGTAAGLAGAGLVQAFAGPFLQDAEEKAAQFEATFSTAFQNIVTEGAAMGCELSIQASVDEFVQDTDKMNAATDTANQLGITRGVVLRAMAGDQDALNVVTERSTALNDEQARLSKLAGEEMLNQGRVSDETAEKLNDLNQQLQGQHDLLGAVNGSYETNTDALNAASEAASAKAEADAYATRKATEQALATAASTGAAQDFTVSIDGATRKLRAMPDGKVVEVTDGGTADLTQQEINAISGKTVTIQAVMNDVQAVVDQAFRYLRPPVITPTIGPYRMRDV